MQRALDRISSTLDQYVRKALPRSLATIELVSAFKVVSRLLIDPVIIQTEVSAYIERVLVKLDQGDISQEEALVNLKHIYTAADRGDADILSQMLER